MVFFFFFNDTATTEIYTLSLHDALPIALSLLALAEGETAPSSRALADRRAGGRSRILLPEQRVLPVRVPLLARLHAISHPAARARRPPLHRPVLARRARRRGRERLGSSCFQPPVLAPAESRPERGRGRRAPAPPPHAAAGTAASATSS